jgi:hypothetical protein
MHRNARSLDRPRGVRCQRQPREQRRNQCYTPPSPKGRHFRTRNRPRELVEDFGFKLATTRYQPSDAIIFGMFMMHSTAPNLSDRYRISIDTRYQPKEEPTDERFFFGEDGTWLGNFYNKGAMYKPMSELREE